MGSQAIRLHAATHLPGGSDPLPFTPVTAGLCPGDFTSIGSFASGDGSGDTLTITVSRGVGCEAIVGVVAATHSTGASGSDMLSITDSRGRSISGPDQIGSAIFQTDLGDSIELTLGLYSIVAGGYAAGDTITCHLDPSTPIVQNSAMAFAITGSATNAFEQGNNGNTFADTLTDGDLLWNDSFGKPFSNFTLASTGAVLTGVAAYQWSGWAPAQGQFLAEHSGGSLYLAASLIPTLANGVDFEPGGALSAGAGPLGVANYAFIELI